VGIGDMLPAIGHGTELGCQPCHLSAFDTIGLWRCAHVVLSMTSAMRKRYAESDNIPLTVGIPLTYIADIETGDRQMTQAEIYTAPTAELNSRLALVEYSTIARQAAEAGAIKVELVKRLEAFMARQAGRAAAKRVTG
jgi:hypothetical protein